ncbi:S8 family peptidase [Gluconobacter cerinus]|uniref:S8 family peptidase n=1 Tax=Gluconobacter cerinus TaxID=38307 RepID=UPI001B8CCB86|nr:S8 family serine peptidase [Gluconobacter cerinus]MBS1019253.1 S8 family serine peptidase [Gluconobacter cerinus]MBS1070059.1 S8 family serine peptidase [Gluconobacter cerinus]
MKHYAILRVEDQRPRVRGFGSAPATLGGSDFKISVERLAEAEALEAADDPQTRAVAPLMPTRLIEPFASFDGGLAAAWGVEAVQATTSPYTGAGVTVAVLDTGIYAQHQAFVGVDLVQEDFSGSGNGDVQGHGTHCAGTILGRAVGDTGRIGVAPGITRALIGKVLSDGGGGESQWLFDGMVWAMRQGADVISMSLGFDFPGMVERLVGEGWPAALATSTALEAYRGNLRMFDALMGVLKAQTEFGKSPLVIAAAGNESRRAESPDFRIAASLPAAAMDVLSVAALGREGGHFGVASFSNTMTAVAGPGVDIVSAWPGGELKALSGTSMACPHVAGVAALWWEAMRCAGTRPTARNVAARILASARTNVLVSGSKESDVGQGLVTAPQVAL